MKIETAQLRDFAERYTAAWCSNDSARVAGFYSPSGPLQANAAAPAVGRDAISEVAHGFMTSFPDMHLLMDDLVIQKNRAVYHWTLTGTNTGPGGTGHRVRISGFEVWRLGADGLISQSKGHFDEASYQHQLKH